MGQQRPLWPGFAPAVFEFPFEGARRARNRAQELSEELVGLRQAHRRARDVVEEGAFAGGAAGRFRARFDRLHDDLARQVEAVDSQVDAIGGHLVEAQRRVDASEAGWRAWWIDYQAWAEWWW